MKSGKRGRLSYHQAGRPEIPRNTQVPPVFGPLDGKRVGSKFRYGPLVEDSDDSMPGFMGHQSDEYWDPDDEDCDERSVREYHVKSI